MMPWKRTLLLFAGLSLAANADLPPAMQSAIGRILRRQETVPRPVHVASLKGKPDGKCAVPLKPMRIEEPERYAIRSVEPRRDLDRMPLGQPRAAPCASIARTEDDRR